MQQIAHRADNENINAPKMSRYWNQVLYLLGVALYVDGNPSSIKIDAFVDVGLELKFVIDPCAEINRDILKNWYKLHQLEISVLSSKLESDFLPNLLADISPRGFQLDILTSIVQILIADKAYSHDAQSLTRKIILHWHMPVKIYDDINYICGGLKADKSTAVLNSAGH